MTIEGLLLLHQLYNCRREIVCPWVGVYICPSKMNHTYDLQLLTITEIACWFVPRFWMVTYFLKASFLIWQLLRICRAYSRKRALFSASQFRSFNSRKIVVLLKRMAFGRKFRPLNQFASYSINTQFILASNRHRLSTAWLSLPAISIQNKDMNKRCYEKH